MSNIWRWLKPQTISYGYNYPFYVQMLPIAQRLNLLGLQTMILEKYGEKHFNAGEQQHLYFQVLALTGQFEAAIEFLSRTEKYRVQPCMIGLK
ncbi:hypothetical protein DOY81_012999 [Sarcophaga bullata]|nr:hypothetical protein DOY81_012999 [Sarcophaga bullata]